MQNKKVVRLTESDIMHMIQNTVSKMLVREDWRETYDKWADGKGDKDDDKDMNEAIKRAISSSINNLMNEESLNEYGNTPAGQYQLGRLAQRNKKVYGNEHDVPQYALDKIEKENDPTPKKNMAMGYAAGMQDQIDFMNAVDDVPTYGKNGVRQAAGKIGLNYGHYKSRNPKAVKNKYSLNNGMLQKP